MAAKTVYGSRNGARSGALTLVLLSAPLTILILRSLSKGPKQQAELRREAGSPAQTTLRAQLKRLIEVGGIERHRRDRFPGVIEYELAPSGRELLFVAEALERWLGKAPGGPISLGSIPAKAAIKALAEGWSATILHALVTTPLSLTELNGIIDNFNYPTLERRLAALRTMGLVEACPSNGAGTPYMVTDWLRQGIAPIVAAARWERRHLGRAATKLDHVDTEAAFLLAAPLLRPPRGLTGSCRLAAAMPNGRKKQLAGIIVDVAADGTACAAQLDRQSDAWALGSPAAWLNALIDIELDQLEIGGNSTLARALVESLHEALFGQTTGHRP